MLRKIFYLPVLLPVLLPAMGPRGSYNAGRRCSSYRRPAWRVDPAAIAAHAAGRGRSWYGIALYERIRASIRRFMARQYRYTSAGLKSIIAHSSALQLHSK